jgi:hypothetical protein
MGVRAVVVRMGIGGLVTAFCLMFASAPAFACPEPSLPCVSELDAHQWRVPKPEANTYDADYQLYNWANGGSKHDLIDHHRTFGADLDFGNGEKVSTGLRQFSFKRPSGKPGPIPASETVAIYDNFTHKYLVNAHQTFGIDLNWADGASYQWRLMPGTTPGSVGLYNTHRGDFVVYGEESFGIDLEWFKEFQRRNPGSFLAPHPATVTLISQPVEEGFVPYFASFGGGVGGEGETLRSITNPSSHVTILFVKNGHNTNQCDEPGAVEPLGPSATFGGPQLALIYGSATPPLRINFVACVVASANVTSLPLNIVYFGPT